jgi:PAS domain S-box-containing protein
VSTPDTPAGAVALPPVSAYRALLDAHPDAMLLVDGSGQILMANPAAERLFGFAREELLQCGVDALVPVATRGHHAGLRDSYGRDPRARPMGVQTELTASRKDGTEVQVEIALSPLSIEGVPYTVASIRSIEAYPRIVQAQRRARYAEAIATLGRIAVDHIRPEDLFDQVPALAIDALEASTALLYVLEEDGQHFRVQAAVGPTCGEPIGGRVPNRPDTPPGYIVGQREAVVVFDYAQENRFAVPRAYVDGGLVSGLGVALSDLGRPFGALVVRSTGARRFGQDEIHFLTALANMVSSRWQRARDEAALRHSQRLDAVGQLTGGVAHDFNNLLTVVQGNLQLLQSHPVLAGQDDVLAALAAALRAARRGGELTAKLLAVARRQVLSPGWVDVAALMQSMGDMLRRTIDPAVEIVVDVDVGGPRALCQIDPTQLESALLNLAINARDAMPDGGMLSLSLRQLSTLPPDVQSELDGVDAPAFVCIQVGDTGCGMPPSVVERAFEPFFTTKDKGRGTGLGLSTVYGFVKQSMGTMRCTSAPGAGTTMRIYLPAEPADDDALEAADAAGVASGSVDLPQVDLTGLQVLLVEDEPDVRTAVHAMLQSLGCEVEPWTTAEQAARRLAQRHAERPVDLVLSDVVLGAGRLGTELADQVAREYPGLPVLLMSGDASGLADLPTTHLRGFLRKPFETLGLAQSISSLFPSRRRDDSARGG